MKLPENACRAWGAEPRSTCHWVVKGRDPAPVIRDRYRDQPTVRDAFGGARASSQLPGAGAGVKKIRRRFLLQRNHAVSGIQLRVAEPFWTMAAPIGGQTRIK